MPDGCSRHRVTVRTRFGGPFQVSDKDSKSVAAFGSVFTERMGVCPFEEGRWGKAGLIATGPIPLQDHDHIVHQA